MKRILFCTIALFICFITFSPRPKINASEVETVKINKSYLKIKEHQEISKYGYFVFKQAGRDLEFVSLALAVIKAESDFDPAAKSYKGAVGLMQLMPDTALDMGRELGIEINEDDLVKPKVNIRLGVGYIRYLQNRLADIEDDERRLVLILASYNSGLHKVKRTFKCRGFECYIERANLCDYNQFNKVLENLPEETKLYLKSVRNYYTLYRKVFNVV